jgi:primosomal protein N'
VTKWRCPSCGRVRATAYCPICGEEPLRARDLGLRDMTGRFPSALSSLDGRLARSFRTLLANAL